MKKNRKKIRYDRIAIVLIILILIIGLIFGGIKLFTNKDIAKNNNEVKMIHLRDLDETNKFVSDNELKLEITYGYNDEKV